VVRTGEGTAGTGRDRRMNEQQGLLFSSPPRPEMPDDSLLRVPERELVQSTLFGDPDDFRLADLEWKGMPEYEQEDIQSWKQIVVHFDSQAALDSFAKLVDQPIGRRTRFMWYPQKDPMEFKYMRYADEETS